MTRVRVRVYSLVLAVVVGIMPVAPPEHAHESDEHGRHHVLIHRHAEAMHGHHAATRPAHKGSVDDDDGRIVLLDDDSTPPVRIAWQFAPGRAVSTLANPFE